MNLQPILEDELIILRPLKREDFVLLFEAASDPEIWEQHPNKDRYKKEEFEKYFTGAIESKGALIVIDKLSGDVIGCSRYYDYHKEKKRVAIGWTFLVKRCWGGKYNSSLKKLMMDNAFEDVEEVIFHIGENNLRSRKAVEKIGGKLLDEDYIEAWHVVYGIRKRDYDRSKHL